MDILSLPRKITDRWRLLHPEGPPGAATAACLYVFAAAMLLYRIGSQPAFAYNWEQYTAWHVFNSWPDQPLNIFKLTDGVMTESGSSPLVFVPVWTAFKVVGVGLLALRVPIALFVALGPVLLWICGRRFIDERTAIVAGVLLTLTPAFLLFGRSATLVGPTLVIAVATMYFMIRCLQSVHAYGYLFGLQMMFAIGAFAYSPVRLLWPTAISLFLTESLIDRKNRGWLLSAAIISVLFLPAFITILDRDKSLEPITAIKGYYNARGEQIFALADQPEGYAFFLRANDADTSPLTSGSDNLARKLAIQNVGDYFNLLLDRNTAPTITDYWNARGSVYPQILVPALAVGLAGAIWRARRCQEYRVLLISWVGLSAPLLLTSRVDVGRLICTLPLLMLFVAIGITLVATAVEKLVSRNLRRTVPMMIPIAALLIVFVAHGTWKEFWIDVPRTHEAQIASVLLDEDSPALRSGQVALVMGGYDQLESELLAMSGVRVQLDSAFHFVDVTKESAVEQDVSKPVIIYGGILDRLRSPDQLPSYCDIHFLINPRLTADFRQIAVEYETHCGKSWSKQFLPE